MKAHRQFVWVVAVVLTMTACGGGTGNDTLPIGDAEVETSNETETPEPVSAGGPLTDEYLDGEWCSSEGITLCWPMADSR